MEIANFSMPCYLKTSQEPKSLFKAPDSYLSVSTAYEMLDNRKISLIRQNDHSLSLTIKNILVAVLIINTLSGLVAFIKIANKGAYIDHRHDNISTYRCMPRHGPLCGHYLSNGVITAAGFWINHTQDKWIPDLSTGLISMVILTIASPLLMGTAWKIWKVIDNWRISVKNEEIAQHNKVIISTQGELLCSSPSLSRRQTHLSHQKCWL